MRRSRPSLVVLLALALCALPPAASARTVTQTFTSTATHAFSGAACGSIDEFRLQLRGRGTLRLLGTSPAPGTDLRDAPGEFVARTGDAVVDPAMGLADPQARRVGVVFSVTGIRCGQDRANTPWTTVPTPLSVRYRRSVRAVLSPTEARDALERALTRRFGRSWTRGFEVRRGCRRVTDLRITCLVRWRTVARRYTARVTVSISVRDLVERTSTSVTSVTSRAAGR